jgi:hypothetical protein
MYLVVATGPSGSVPIRLFGSVKEAKSYAKSKWDAACNEATEDVYVDAFEAGRSSGLPRLSDISELCVLRFRNGFVLGCVCCFRKGTEYGNVD